MKNIAFVLLCLTTIGLIAQPVKADQAVIQDARQESYIEGYNNTSVQQSSQSNRTRRVRSDSDSSGYVQTSDQYSDVVGEGLYSGQKVQQSNVDTRLRRDRRDSCNNGC